MVVLSTHVNSVLLYTPDYAKVIAGIFDIICVRTRVYPCLSWESTVISCRAVQGKSLTDPNTSMEMTVLLQQRNGPATDAAIKPFNLDSAVSAVR